MISRKPYHLAIDNVTIEENVRFLRGFHPEKFQQNYSLNGRRPPLNIFLIINVGLVQLRFIDVGVGANISLWAR